LKPYPLRQRAAIAYITADLNFVMFMKRYPEPVPAPGQLAYLWGGASLNWASWQGASVAGMLLADVIPPQWGLGFAGTLALLGLTCSLLLDRAAWFAAAVAGCAAVAAYALPLKLNIVVAIAAAVAAGLIIDHGSSKQPVPAGEDAT
jgi:predicted branched-subunit amino acid permease